MREGALPEATNQREPEEAAITSNRPGKDHAKLSSRTAHGGGKQKGLRHGPQNNPPSKQKDWRRGG